MNAAIFRFFFCFST
ncbi:TPA: pheST operon leader peptide PheM [Klebsiella variicola]|nr:MULTISPECIES: pheST operon leader peptide PheM [Klebsiella]MBZ1726155.1 pheST operon leader peptide PheM [Klebsiella pneumoniae]HDS7655211.1 pheST operon leader peptide PheM [Klebsiella variicola]HDU5591397.1 pheST operon leader peptide PheM [Klebsiella variicola]